MKKLVFLTLLFCGIGFSQTVTCGLVPAGYSSDAACTCYLATAASTNASNCKTSAANLYDILLTNTTTTVYYLRFYNSASNPTCSSATGFMESIAIPPGASAGLVGGISKSYSWPKGFQLGLGFCVTGGSGSTDNTNAATGVFISILFK